MKLLERIGYMVLVAGGLLLTSCNAGDASSTVTESHMSIGLKPGYWTYISLKDSATVGFGQIGDSLDDANWHDRTDWDIAFSEYGIRTNSGTSGIGNGGLTVLPDSVPAEEITVFRNDYKPDTAGILMPMPLGS